VSLSENCQGNDGGVTFEGGVDIDIDGGGVFSNSCLEANGSSVDVCVDSTPSGNCNGDGFIGYLTDYNPSGNPSLDPPPINATEPMPEFDVDEADCSSLPDQGQQNGGGNISPGRYSRIRLPNGNLTMQPGLYCLYGEFTETGGSLTANDVTIYMASGDFSTSGNADVFLDAPPQGCDTSPGSTQGCPPSIPGMLIYMPSSNAGDVSLEGNSTSLYEGAIYAPTGTIDVGGTSSAGTIAFNTQLVGNTVKIHGNVTIDIDFDDQVTFERPATLDLLR
jgi:hypothetical protein